MKKDWRDRLPVVYVPRKTRVVEVLTSTEELGGFTIVYYWFHFPFNWSPRFKPYDWEPIAYAFRRNVAVKVFWRPHYQHRCGRPVRLNGRPVIRISPFGNAPRVTPTWDLISIFDGPFVRYRRLSDRELLQLIREGWPPEEQADAESFRRFVQERVNNCNGAVRALRAIVELLRARAAYLRKDIHSMFRHTALAYLTAPKRYRLSDMGDTLLRSTIMLWHAHRICEDNDFRKELFFADFEGFDRELLLHTLLMIPLTLAKPPRTEDDLKRATRHYMKAFNLTTI